MSTLRELVDAQIRANEEAKEREEAERRVRELEELKRAKEQFREAVVAILGEDFADELHAELSSVGENALVGKFWWNGVAILVEAYVKARRFSLRIWLDSDLPTFSVGHDYDRTYDAVTGITVNARNLFVKWLAEVEPKLRDLSRDTPVLNPEPDWEAALDALDSPEVRDGDDA